MAGNIFHGNGKRYFWQRHHMPAIEQALVSDPENSAAFRNKDPPHTTRWASFLQFSSTQSPEEYKTIPPKADTWPEFHSPTVEIWREHTGKEQAVFTVNHHICLSFMPQKTAATNNLQHVPISLTRATTWLKHKPWFCKTLKPRMRESSSTRHSTELCQPGWWRDHVGIRPHRAATNPWGCSSSASLPVTNSARVLTFIPNQICHLKMYRDDI